MARQRFSFLAPRTSSLLFQFPDNCRLTPLYLLPIHPTRYIHKGKIVGEIYRPSQVLQLPAEQLNKYVESAKRTSALIASLLHSDPPGQPEEVQPPHASEELSKANFAPSTPPPAKVVKHPPFLSLQRSNGALKPRKCQIPPIPLFSNGRPAGHQRLTSPQQSLGDATQYCHIWL